MRTLFTLILLLSLLASGCQMTVAFIHGEGNSMSVAASGLEVGEGDGATSEQPSPVEYEDDD